MGDNLEDLVNVDADEIRMIPRDHYSRLLATIAIATRGSPPANTWYQLAELVNASPLLVAPYADGLPDDYGDGTVIENVIDAMLLAATNDWVDADYRFEATGCVPATGQEFCRDVRLAWTVMSTTLQAAQFMHSVGGDVTRPPSRSSSSAPTSPRKDPPGVATGDRPPCPLCGTLMALGWMTEEKGAVRPVWCCPDHGIPR